MYHDTSLATYSCLLTICSRNNLLPMACNVLYVWMHADSKVTDYTHSYRCEKFEILQVTHLPVVLMFFR